MSLFLVVDDDIGRWFLLVEAFLFVSARTILVFAWFCTFLVPFPWFKQAGLSADGF